MAWMQTRRPTRWSSGSFQRITEGGAASLLAAILLLVFGILLPGLRDSESASTDVAPTPTPTTAAECLLKMSGDSFGFDTEDVFILLSNDALHFSELLQTSPVRAQVEAGAIIDSLRFRAWKLRKLVILITERDIEFAGEIFDTAMAAVEAADLIQFDSTNSDGIKSALSRVSATATDVA